MPESKNIQSELISKIATGFCGGISRTCCCICGAQSGAIMAINLFYGRSLPDEPVGVMLQFKNF
ncbi:MAG: C_GCAxxG_C_C family protein [Desulfobacterales bacterium]|nr:C_GCAxxG_C_C family protein [Desulfobacterales bacterium]